MDLSLAAAVNQNTTDLSKEAERIKSKEDAGADFFMSQPVFSKDQIFELCNFFRAYSKKPLMVGIWPITSLKTARLIREKKIEGVIMPTEIYNECERIGAESSFRLNERCISLALDLIEYIRSSTSANGVYIVAPLRNPQNLLPLLEKLNLK